MKIANNEATKATITIGLSMPIIDEKKSGDINKSKKIPKNIAIMNIMELPINEGISFLV